QTTPSSAVLEHGGTSTRAAELCQQRPGLTQIGGVEALSEPAVHVRQQCARLVAPPLRLPQPAQAHGHPHRGGSAQCPPAAGPGRQLGHDAGPEPHSASESAYTRDQTPPEAGATASHYPNLPQQGVPCGTPTPLLSSLVCSIPCHTEGKRMGRHTTHAVV